METKDIVESILETVRKELTEFVEQESEIASSIEYEERVVQLCRQFGTEVLKGTSGKIPKSRNSKKKSTRVSDESS